MEPIDLEVEEVELEEVGRIKPPLKDDSALLWKIPIGLAGIGFMAMAFWFLTEDILTVIGFLTMTGIYIAFCPKKIEPEEKGVKVTLWTPHDDHVYSGGLYWRWFLFEWFYLFPTEQLIIDIPEQEVITIRKEVEGESYDAVTCKIDAALYCFWPNTAERLCQAYRRAPNPHDLEKLKTFFSPNLASLVRRVAGRFPWIEVQESHTEYTSALHDEIRGDVDGPIYKAGIDSFSVVNKLVKLPPDIEEAISMRQKSRYSKEAGILDAELERIKLTEKGKGDAEATRLILNAMEENSEMAKLLTLQKMAQGEASTIFVEIPRELKGALGDGEIPQELVDIWNATPKPIRTEALTKLLKSLNKK